MTSQPNDDTQQVQLTSQPLSVKRLNHFKALNCLRQSVYWHMGRLGILGTAVLQLADVADSDNSKKSLMIACQKVVNTVIGMVNANPACLRPMLDIHHIELFLV